MKLLQRIALGYYRAKLKAIGFFSAGKAGEAAFELFCTPYTRRRTYTMPAIFEKAERLSFEFEKHTINGFRWKPEKPNGCKILICHGFDSYSYKFERYISPLQDSGFEVLAFDAPAHGVTPGKRINALLYQRMIVQVDERYGPVDGIMAHSFGCVAVCLAIEHFKSDCLKRLVLIAPATETTRSIKDFCRHLRIGAQVRAELENIIVKIGGKPVSWYSVARVIKEISTPTLWVHDKYDTITPYADMRDLQQLPLPHVSFIITKGLGHSLYRNEAVAEDVISFFKTL